MQSERELILEGIFSSYGGNSTGSVGVGGGGGDADNQQMEELEQLISLPDEGAGGDHSMDLNAAHTRMEMAELNKPNEFLRFSLRMGFGALLHPYEYAKVLMQLGYEPLPAVISTSWLGRSTLVLPGVHQYMRYIKHNDGFIGLYRGLTPRIFGTIGSALFSESLVRLLGISPMSRKELTMYPVRAYAWNLMRDSLVIATGLAVSHPFYVITVRQMAQFVGREVVYTGIWGSVRQIFAQEGWVGFYAGFVPRLLCDLGVLFFTSTLGTICNRIFKLKQAPREYNAALLQFGAIMLLYPLQVVGACMACSGSGIAAGAPPFMPIYGKWIDCLVDLMGRGDHFRGAFIFRRSLPKMHKQIQMQRLYYDPFTVSRMI